MKTLYFDCSMGAAGDMLAASLLELVPDPGAMVKRLNALGIPGIEYQLDKTEKNGITGSHLTVKVFGREEESLDHDDHHHHDHHDHEECHGHDHHHDHEDGHVHDHYHDHEDDHVHDHHHDHEECHVHDHHHDHEEGHVHDHGHDHEECHGHDHHHDHEEGHAHHHSHHTLGDIDQVVRSLDLPDKVKDEIMAVYRSIAEAESHVHGKEITQIHFHEVGTMDAVADVTAVCLLMEELGAERIAASAVHVGSGHVHCAHGILPVPAPATAYLLRGIPSYAGEIRGELCTPTGAALLRHFVSSYGPQPPMTVLGIGYGMGKKDFEQANCIRAMLGESADDGRACEDGRETVLELKCNLDDMTPEEIGFAMETLLDAGALDVFTLPAGMKKNRPGTLFTCLCRENQREEMLRLIFRHTTTLGIRETVCRRYVLSRSMEKCRAGHDEIGVKKVSGYGVSRSKPEYEDLARIARQKGISLREAASEAEQ